MTKKKATEESAGRPITKVLVRNLLLDAENPRLASAKGRDKQEDLLKTLWTEMAVDEVALSIAANGFFEEEPLFVIPENPREKDEARRRYLVVEGNRRLAAVMLLCDPVLRKRIVATDLPPLSQDAITKLKRLPVSVYQTREELWQFFGFRHINEPKPWDAFSKARYMAEVHENYEVPLAEIANSIGDRHSTVLRLYRGVKLLEQAEQAGRFKRKDAVKNRFYFLISIQPLISRSSNGFSGSLRIVH